MWLSWIYFSRDGQYVADIVSPTGEVTSLRVDTLKELRSMTLSQLKDDHQRSLANDLFKEFAAGQIKNAIVGIEKTSNLLRRMAA